jgi:hypothetical protein
MKTSIPLQLQGYQECRRDGLLAFLWRINSQGWFQAICIGGLIVGILKHAPGIVNAGFLVAFLASVAFHNVYSQWRKTHSRCPNCRQPMATVEVGITAGDFGVHKWPFTFTGADRCLYQAEPALPGQHSSRLDDSEGCFLIRRLVQRWSVCHPCKCCIFASGPTTEVIHRSLDRDRYKRAKDMIESDPDALTKIREANQYVV